MSLFTLTLNIFNITHPFVFAMKAERSGLNSAPTVDFTVEFIQMWKLKTKQYILKLLSISILFFCFFFSFFCNPETVLWLHAKLISFLMLS